MLHPMTFAASKKQLRANVVPVQTIIAGACSRSGEGWSGGGGDNDPGSRGSRAAAVAISVAIPNI